MSEGGGVRKRKKMGRISHLHGRDGARARAGGFAQRGVYLVVALGWVQAGVPPRGAGKNPIDLKTLFSWFILLTLCVNNKAY